MKPGTFKITNYSMGRAVTEVVQSGTLSEAQTRAERFPALGLPGSGPRSGSHSRVVGIKRIGD